MYYLYMMFDKFETNFRQSDIPMNIVESFIVKMKNLNKGKKDSSRVFEMLNIVKEFPFVCGLDIENTQKNKKFKKEAWKLAETILQLFAFIPNDTTTLSDIFQVLIIIGSFYNDLPESANYKLIVSMIIDNIKEDADLHSQLSFLSTLCMFPTFIKTFFFADYFTEFVESLMTDESKVVSFNHFTEIFSRVVHFQSITLPKVLNIIQIVVNNIKQSKYTSETIGNTANFISSFLEKASSKNASVFKKFMQLDGISLIYNSLQQFHSTAIRNYFKSLLKTYDGESKTLPNSYVSDFISKTIQVDCLENIELIFLALSDIIIDPSIDLNAFDKSINFTSLFERQNLIKANSIINILASLINRQYSNLTDIVILLLNTENLMERIQKLAPSIENVVNMNLITITPQNSPKYEEFFMSNQNPEKLCKLISDYKSISDLLLIFYTNTTEKQLHLMKRIFELSDLFSSTDSYVNLISNLLSINFSAEKIKLFALNLSRNFSLPLFSALTSFFNHSQDNVTIFINFGGFPILKEIFNRTDLSDDSITDMLIAMSSHPFNKALNHYIMNMSPEHRFFRLSKDCYRRLLLDPKRINPIRLPTFIPFLDFPLETIQATDIMNLAKYALPIYERLGKPVPNLNLIANSNLNTNLALNLIDKYKLWELVTTNSENFPFFEFLPSQGTSFIELNTPFFGISFWFKCNVKYPHEITLFQGNDVTITINIDILTIKWAIEEKRMKINTDDWHFVFISSSGWMYAEMINIMIDDQEYKFQTEQLFQSIYIGSPNFPCNSPFRVSANIKIYDSLFQDIASIGNSRQKGPGNFTCSQMETLIAFRTKKMNLGQSVSLVESRPLSSFIDIPAFISKLFTILKGSADDLIFNTEAALSLYKNSGMKNESFWYYMIITLKDIRPITNEVYHMIINFILENYDTEKAVDIFRSIFLDIELWMMLDNNEKIVLISLITNPLINNLKDFVVSQGWIPFLLRVYMMIDDENVASKFGDDLIKLLMTANDENSILTVFCTTIFGLNTEKVHICPNLGVKLLHQLTLNVDFCSKFIPPNWVNAIITNINHERTVSKALELLLELRKNNPEKYSSLVLPPMMPRFIGNPVYYLHAWSTLTDEIIIDLKTDNINIKYESMFSYVCSVHFANFSALTYAIASGQDVNDNLENIVKDGFNVLSNLIPKNNQIYTNRNLIFLFCFMIPISFAALVGEDLQKIIEKIPNQNVNYLGFTQSDYTTISSCIFNAFSIDEQTRNDFINEKDYMQVPSLSVHALQNYIDSFVESIEEIGLKANLKPVINEKTFIDFLENCGFLNFIKNLLNANKDSPLLGQLISFCALFEPFIIPKFSAVLLQIVMDSNLKISSLDNIAMTLAKIICNGGFDDKLSEAVNLSMNFIACNERIRGLLMEALVYYILPKMNEDEIKNSFENLQKYFNNQYISVDLFLLMITNQSKSVKGMIANYIATSTETFTNIKDFITKNADKKDPAIYIQNIQKFIHGADIDFSELTHPINEFSVAHINKEIKEEEPAILTYEKFATNTTNAAFNSFFMFKAFSRLSSPLLQKLFDYNTFASIRQTECFVVSVWQSEILLKESQEDYFVSKLTKPYNLPCVLRRKICPDIKLVEECSIAEEFADKLFIEAGQKIHYYPVLPHQKDDNIVKYTSWIFTSETILFKSFLKRFFKFGQFKSSYSLHWGESQSVLFCFSPAMLLLVGATSEGEKLSFAKTPSWATLHTEIVNYEHGQFTSFCGHPILIINPYDVIDYVMKEKTLTLLRINSSPLHLSFSNTPKLILDILPGCKSYMIKRLPPGFIKHRTASDLITLWQERKISSMRFLIEINSENYINGIEPKLPHNKQELTPELHNLKEVSISDQDVSNICREFDVKYKARQPERWIDLKIEKRKKFTINTPDGMIISHKLSPIVDFSTNGVSSSERLVQIPEFVFVTHTAASEDGAYLIADFSFGVVTVFMVNFVSGVISNLTPVSNISIDYSSISAVCSNFMLAASATDEYIYFWNFARGIINCKVQTPFAVVGLDFDNDQCLWVWGSTQIALFSINGTLLGAYNFNNDIINIKPLPDKTCIAKLTKNFENRIRFANDKLDVF